MTFYVITEMRTYNAIDSKSHLDIVRKNMKDTTKIKSVWKWNEKWEEVTEEWQK